MESKIAGKSFLLVGANHLASNPRLIKMMEFLVNNGAIVDVLYLETFQKNYKFDEEIIVRNPSVNFIKLSKFEAAGFQKVKDRFHRSVAKLLAMFSLTEWFGYQNWFSKRIDSGLNKKSQFFNFLIAYNFESLPVGLKLASRFGAKLIYDIEDLYAYAGTKCDRSIIKIEEFYYSKAYAILLASPYFKSIIFDHYKVNGHVLRNVFDHLPPQGIVEADGYIKLVWFSQTVGLDRGLQDIISAINDPRFANFQLTIIGNCSIKVKSILEQLGPIAHQQGQVLYRPLLGYYELGYVLQGFDVGLLLEQADSLNRDLCETNKGFQYLSAGIPFILSNTIAQRAFHEENEDCSFIYERGNIIELQNILLKLMEPGQIDELKDKAHNASLRYSYSIEMQGIMSLFA